VFGVVRRETASDGRRRLRRRKQFFASRESLHRIHDTSRALSGRVDTVITRGSPFGGSPWAGVLPFVEIVRAL
jgi:hypothetical protein